jgi:hypothetical protein
METESRNLGKVASYKDAARKFADLASSHDKIIAGPVLALKAGACRHVAFPDKSGALAVVLLGVDARRAGTVEAAVFANELKVFFATVTLCGTFREFGEATLAAWPGAKNEWLDDIDFVETNARRIGT